MIKGGEFETLNSCIKPFLNCVRIPKFKNREDSKYIKIIHQKKTKYIFILVAWYGDHWSYDLYKGT